MNEGDKLPTGSDDSEVVQHMKKEAFEVKILGYEADWWNRGVKEAIQIKRHKPSLNKDAGRYNLSRIWDLAIKDQPINTEDTAGGSRQKKGPLHPRVTRP